MSNDPRNPNEGKRAAPNAATLATVRARLHIVEHCIVRSAADAADQVRELARLLDATAEHVQHVSARLDALERDAARLSGPNPFFRTPSAIDFAIACAGCEHTRARHLLGGEPCECRIDGCPCESFVEPSGAAK